MTALEKRAERTKNLLRWTVAVAPKRKRRLVGQYANISKDGKSSRFDPEPTSEKGNR